jgi:VanZ family protein
MNYFQAKLTKNLSEHKNLFLAFAVLWTAMITYLCLVDFKVLPKIGIGGFDKYVHFTFHFVFTTLWFLYLKSKKEAPSGLYLKTFLASLVYGIAIEIAQALFTTTRKADVLDVCANASGSFVAILILFLLLKVY